MPSPFPGMDPYLEAPEIWEDFHSSLAGKIRAQLAPRVRPRYYAALTPRVTYEEVTVERARSVKPDVSVLKVSDRPLSRGAAALAPAPIKGLVTLELPYTEHSVEIRESGTGTLVTAIEILSPVNKRPGHEAFDAYRKKRRDLLRSAAHLLEIDLLRAGKRPPLETPLPDAPYFVVLSREERRPEVEIWPIRVQDPIPPVPVPLIAPDPDAPLDLGAAIQAAYTEAEYDLRVDYEGDPPGPDFPPQDLEWIRCRTRAGSEGNG
ncbi:MAG: DUF4058 family protein [Planctomycetes bacterium]|nr:DUF4058 family protein [Planctomycetota bacterium]